MKTIAKSPPRRSANAGAVLLVAMVFMLLLALVAGTVMQTSMLEFRMAGNDQFREEAFQQAQAVAASITEDINNFPVSGAVGYTICQAGSANPDCNITTLNYDTTVVTDADLVSALVTREGPLILETFPVRLSESQTSSSPSFDAAVFEVQVEYNGSEEGLGNAAIVQGTAVRIASSSQ
ncbi:pilus assembly PilX family protein [Porticoccus sp.]|uniref:pilus assembly PilX family protein n=1 Tax=Porticoccus sp. TaxID=2024853 RepID=UPI003F6A4A4F